MSSNEALRSRLRNCVPQGVAHKELFLDRAANAELWDVDGRHYIDFAAGVAVLNTGHRHPRVMQAVKDQLEAVDDSL